MINAFRLRLTEQSRSRLRDVRQRAVAKLDRKVFRTAGILQHDRQHDTRPTARVRQHELEVAIHGRRRRNPYTAAPYTNQCGMAITFAQAPVNVIPNQTSWSTAAGFQKRSQGT